MPLLFRHFSLAEGFVEHDAGGNADIETLDGSVHGDTHLVRAKAEVGFVDAAVLAAHDDGKGYGEVGIGVVVVCVFGRGDKADAGVTEVLKTLLQIVHLADGQRVECTRGGLDRVTVDADAAARCDNECVGSRTSTGTGYGTKVADIGDAVQHHKEGRPALFKKSRDNILNPMKING